MALADDFDFNALTTSSLTERLPLYIKMSEVTYSDYLRFRAKSNEIYIGGVSLSLEAKPSRELEPRDFRLETSTIWSFPKRGDWATHKYNNKYRGNWAPQVARNLILLYSREGEVVLDPFMGSGTTVIECKLLRRKCLGVDINYESVILAWSRLDFRLDGLPPYYEVKLYHGDARNLELIDDEAIDFIAAHPPYANIIKYGKGGSTNGNLSHMSVREYLSSMRDVAKELFRVLKPGKFLAIMIGDTRSKRHIIPLGYLVMKIFLDEGFIIKEHIIKVQHNMRGTVSWRRRNNDFLLLSHEHIFVFRKPLSERDFSSYYLSSRQVMNE